MHRLLRFLPLYALTLSACAALAPAATWDGPSVAHTLTQQSFAPATPCTGSFRAYPLAHTTTVAPPVHLFASNGAGIAAGDVDGDGLTDLVVAHIAGDSTLARNSGSFTFTETPLDLPNTRAIQLVDVDGDGRLDITATHQGAGVSILFNESTPSTLRFRRAQIAFGNLRAYSMLWHDYNHDGRLDLVTGSYDAEAPRGGAQSIFDAQSNGVFLHSQRADGGFVTQRLSDHANALSLIALDIDADGADDIVVGNDFDTRDMVFLQRGDTWETAQPFVSTPHSTMSYDVGDYDRDGAPDLLAADMNPYSTDVVTLAQWLPVTSNMTQYHPADDPQLMENAVLQRGSDQRWRNASRALSATSTGWSWSTRYADFDNDGHLDIYAVNGMIAAELFPFLPDNALVEHNQALRFDGTRYIPAPEWQLGATASGRGMTVADFDNDGRLDIAVNNLNAPSVVYANGLCGGSALSVTLQQPGPNPHAVGAEIRLYSGSETRWQRITTTRGYISGSPAVADFGMGKTPADSLVVRWPDGGVSTIDALPTSGRITITRSAP
ncbi:MAG: hypothetical protein RLZZ297_546 [Chloroflexota bacterium]|jgi:hypothetical protein